MHFDFFQYFHPHLGVFLIDSLLACFAAASLMNELLIETDEIKVSSIFQGLIIFYPSEKLRPLFCLEF